MERFVPISSVFQAIRESGDVGAELVESSGALVQEARAGGGGEGAGDQSAAEVAWVGQCLHRSGWEGGEEGGDASGDDGLFDWVGALLQHDA